jgi:hypothetical protein
MTSLRHSGTSLPLYIIHKEDHPETDVMSQLQVEWGLWEWCSHWYTDRPRQTLWRWWVQLRESCYDSVTMGTKPHKHTALKVLYLYPWCCFIILIRMKKEYVSAFDIWPTTHFIFVILYDLTKYCIQVEVVERHVDCQDHIRLPVLYSS